MSNDATPRERIADVLYNLDGCSFEEQAFHVMETYHAHLWQAASDPEVVEAVARFGIDGWDDYTPDGPLQEGARNMAKGEIAELLTLLIGPPPTNR